MQKIGDIPNTRADSNGEFTDGNVAGGVPPTILPAAWFNTIQRELMSVLSAAEIDADSAQFNQVLLSIQKLIGEGIPDLKDASTTQKGIVQLSNSINSTSQILAATPKAVSDLGALLLKINNNLSEIKDAGPAAVAQTLLNLGLGDAAKRTVGTGTNQIPDMNSFASGTVGTPGAAGYGGWCRLPSGVYYQWGAIVGSTSGPSTGNFPVPFPTGAQLVIVTPNSVNNAVFGAGNPVNNASFRYAFRGYNSASSTSNDGGWFMAIGI
ncbi:bacteriophage tail fiber protein [Yersinia intermedia]|uniref:tail fiber protein n=1 Tax=Yersinia intermedia TaxID=631 RepID=UPI0005DC1414|nr:phage tail protein [Yersinia intermedia]CNI08039.1 bacteriophage tail fiber protein [Yersinia intermedia]